MILSVTNAGALGQVNRISIFNDAESIMTPMTNIDGGPDVGNILNFHFFPGLRDYLKGNNRSAMSQLTYFLDRPQYSSMNPKQNQYFSIGHYVRGMIYFYHAQGVGRLELARMEFDSAILRNPNNHFAYLELARVYSLLGFKQQAVLTLQKVLKLNPEGSLAQEVRRELALVQQQK